MGKHAGTFTGTGSGGGSDVQWLWVCGDVGTDLASRPLRRHQWRPATHLLPVLHTNDSNCAGFPEVKAGDVLTDLVGTLTYHFDQYKLVLEPNPVRAIETDALAPFLNHR